MAKRTRQPKRNRTAQRTASATLVRSGDTPVTMAQIANARGSLRGGRLSRLPAAEFGASGTMNVAGRITRDDYNVLFDGKNALPIYDQMDRSDGQVGAAGEIIKLPLRSSQQSIQPPDNPSDNEKAIADAANEALFGDGMFPAGEGWDFYLRHLLMRVTFGFGLLEKVWMFDDDRGVLRYRRLAPRLPRTVDQFDVNADGSLRNIVQYVSVPGTGRFEYKNIPAEYAVLSVRDREGDNYFGRSIYRRQYKHWFYKDEAYRIEAVRLDRYGVGIPVAKLGPGFVATETELNEIEWMLRSLRSHESAWAIEPDGVTFRIMTPENGSGGASGAMTFIEHHATMIVRGVLAGFLSDHAEGLNSNRTQTLTDLFLHALKGEARGVQEDVDTQLVRPFCDVNFDMSQARYPRYVMRGIGDLTVEQLALSLAPFVTAGVVTADDSLEDVVRKLLGVPPLPDGWRRGDKKPAPPPIAPPPPLNTAGGKASGPTDIGVQSKAADNAGKTNTNQVQTNSADAVDLATAIGDAIVGAIEATPKPEPQGPDPRLGALVDQIRDLDARVSASLSAPPPELPPIVLNLGSKQSVKRLVRGDDGRIEGVITESEPMELYTGQPRNPHGEFAFGKKPGSESHPALNKRSADFVAHNASGTDTRSRFSDGHGRYTPDRQALHDAIVQKFIGDTKPVDSPVATILGGGSASGKSSLLKAKGLNPSNSVPVDVDEIRKHLPEYGEMLRAGRKDASSITHEESADIARQLTRTALDTKRNITLDGTGDTTIEKMTAKIDQMHAAGHGVRAVYVSVPVDEAIRRSDARGAKTGRYVPHAVIEHNHAAVSDVFPKAIAAGLFDDAMLYDTTSEPRLLVTARGSRVTVHDDAGWQAFKAKANAYK